MKSTPDATALEDASASLETEVPSAEEEAEAEEGLLSRIDAPIAVAAAGFVGVRKARLIELSGTKAVVELRRGRRLEALIDAEVDLDLLENVVREGGSVLVEADPDEEPIVIGVLQTKTPEELTLKARKIVIEADEELTLRSGTAAMRLRQDGDVELVGSRIVSTSRGLFRLVGRMLRLN